MKSWTHKKKKTRKKIKSNLKQKENWPSRLNSLKINSRTGAGTGRNDSAAWIGFCQVFSWDVLPVGKQMMRTDAIIFPQIVVSERLKLICIVCLCGMGLLAAGHAKAWVLKNPLWLVVIDDDGRPSSRLSMIIERQSFESGAKRKTKQKESVSEMFGNGETREEEEGEKKKEKKCNLVLLSRWHGYSAS